MKYKISKYKKQNKKGQASGYHLKLRRYSPVHGMRLSVPVYTTKMSLRKGYIKYDYSDLLHEKLTYIEVANMFDEDASS